MSTGHAETRYGALSESFKVAARSEYPGYAPMYERLALGIAEDQEMLALAAGAQKGQWVPNLLFGAVHFLLLKGLQHPLSASTLVVSLLFLLGVAAGAVPTSLK